MTERSILAAVSGIDANETYLDSIANNIANADTVGFKAGTVQFQDLLAEQLSGASAPTAETAGVNPVSVGSGVVIGATSSDLTEGSLEETSQPTDVAIQGNGYLVVNSDGTQAFTRDGELTVDANGSLATESGGLIMGWQASGSGVINNNTSITPLTIPTGETIAASATTSLTLGGNLPAWDGTGTPPVETTTLDAYDALGNAVPVTVTFTGVANTANEWNIQASVTSPSGSTEDLFTTQPTIKFNTASGEVSSVSGATTNADGSLSLPVGSMPTGYDFPASDTWNLTFPPTTSANAVTQFAGEETIQITSQNGHAAGSLQSFSIGQDGTITGSFSDGTTLSLGQIALASFNNANGLSDQGGGLYTATANSGQPQIGTPTTGDRGSLLGGELEQSNVDLGTELTDLISAQESYQANTKVLTSVQQAVEALENAA